MWYQEKMSVEQTRKRLQELLAAYPHLEQEAAAQDDTKPGKPIVSLDSKDLLPLYQSYHTWLIWHYGLSQELRELVNFNVAEDVHHFVLAHNKLGQKSEKGSHGNNLPLSEPVLEWLPLLLKADGAPIHSKHYTDEEKRDAIPLWSDERLFAYLAAIPGELLRQHAMSRGLLGGHEANAKAQSSNCSANENPQRERSSALTIPHRDLAHGKGWFPVPKGAPWPQQMAILSGEAPFQLPLLS